MRFFGIFSLPLHIENQRARVYLFHFALRKCKVDGHWYINNHNTNACAQRRGINIIINSSRLPALLL